MTRVVGWVDRWARRSNARATANARGAATECSRRRVERAEVEAFLASLAAAPVSTSLVTTPAAASVH